MPRTKRKMVRILRPELFEKGKQVILKFESEMVEQGIKKPEKLSDSKINAIMLKTCLSLWGEGEDLYLCSAKRNFEQGVEIVNQLDADRIHKLLAALSEWLDLEIIYRRSGNLCHFSFTRSDGQLMELTIEAGKVSQSESEVVTVH